MPVKFVPTSKIKATLGIEPNGRVQAFFTQTCYNHMDKYVPMDNGDLRNDVTITKNSITYEVPYAYKQYSTQFEHYTTPDTGPYWDKEMWSAEGVDVMKEVQAYFDRR